MRKVTDAIVEDLRNNKKLRGIHLQDAMETFIEGDFRTGILMLRNLINATSGFPSLAKALNKNEKSLMRMLSPGQTLKSDNLFKILQFLMEQENLTIQVNKRKVA